MKKTVFEFQERYVAPACETVNFIEEGFLCISGEGSIDDGSFDEWGNY